MRQAVGLTAPGPPRPPSRRPARGCIVGGAGLLVTCVLLFCGRLVPRLVSVLGVAAVLSQMSGISLELFQRDLPMLMLLPLFPMQLVLCLWLLARGFAAPATRAAP